MTTKENQILDIREARVTRAIKSLEGMGSVRTIRRNMLILILWRAGYTYPQIQTKGYHLSKQRLSKIVNDMEKLLQTSREVS